MKNVEKHPLMTYTIFFVMSASLFYAVLSHFARSLTPQAALVGTLFEASPWTNTVGENLFWGIPVTAFVSYLAARMALALFPEELVIGPLAVVGYSFWLAARYYHESGTGAYQAADWYLVGVWALNTYVVHRVVRTAEAAGREARDRQAYLRSTGS